MYVRQNDGGEVESGLYHLQLVFESVRTSVCVSVSVDIFVLYTVCVCGE